MAIKTNTGGVLRKEPTPKKTTIGKSKNSRPVSKNDRRLKKPYRGQGK